MVGRFKFNWYRKKEVGLVAREPLKTDTLGRIFKDDINYVDNKLDSCIVVVGIVLADNDDNRTGNKIQLLDLRPVRSHCRKPGLVEGPFILANIEIAS